MKYIDHGSGGPASVLKIAEGEQPVLKTGEVLIEVQYAGVNRPDVMQRSGKYPPPPGASLVIGLEVAGKIVEVAPDVTQWKAGDSVCALTPGGGYAEYCAVPAVHCLPVPKGLTVEQAASLPENWFTVWTNVIDRGRLKEGETFLVHGGSSGIGLAAIQLAKAWGATVYTTVGSAIKADYCRRMGADAVWNYKDDDWAAELWKATEKRGVDMILDMVGGEYVEKNIRSLALEGRLVQIAFLQPSKVSIDCMPILVKRLTFTGSTLRPRTIEQKAAIAQSLLEHVWPRFESGALQTYLYRTFPLAEVAAAHELMESSTHIGKIMLAVREA
ncbi:MAG: NAD(P)H-quinone oxidoreductase [Gammaproteobacteria bacterium]|nr:NAD(P)H-quinone oxidoreductase [Gammaproteobacteria bacterium]